MCACFSLSENIYLVSCLAGVLFAQCELTQATIYTRYRRDLLFSPFINSSAKGVQTERDLLPILGITSKQGKFEFHFTFLLA